MPFCSGWGKLFICKVDILKKIQDETKTKFCSFKRKIGPDFKILTSFEYYKNKIDIYTNRWGSASKTDLNQNAYKIGFLYQQIDDHYPKLIKKIRRIISILGLC